MKEQKMAVQSAAAPNKLFNKADFKKEILENIKLLFRKTIDNASQEEIFQAVSLAAKDIRYSRALRHKKYNGRKSKDRLLSVHGVFDRPCPWQQPDQSALL